MCIGFRQFFSGNMKPSAITLQQHMSPPLSTSQIYKNHPRYGTNDPTIHHNTQKQNLHQIKPITIANLIELPFLFKILKSPNPMS